MAEAETKTSKYWLDQVVVEIVKKYPQGEIIVSSGISPSASYHIGHFPEILIVDVIAWALRQAGRKVKHIHVVDNFDPLRKRYSFLPEWLEEFVGQPICFVPAPDKSQQTYADYFYNEFETYAKQMQIKPDQVVKSYEDLYKSGKMTGCFEDVLSNVDKIHSIFEQKANRKLEPGWTPVQVLGDDSKLSNADIKDWDKDAKTIANKSYADGHAKLNWRLDWPARWKVLGVMVEPFSHQEHGAAGSSYDTGSEFARQIFNIEAPMPGVQYGNIHLVGETKKMSSSLGNFVTPKQALKILPPEILRYSVVKSRPEKSQEFDPGKGIYRLWEEYKGVEKAVLAGEEHEFSQAYRVANAHTKGRVTSDVPYDHLVAVYQAALGEFSRVLELLRRTGYEAGVKTQQDLIKQEVAYVKAWLDTYAPEDVKFEVQQALPKAELSDAQKQLLSGLAAKLEDGHDLEAQKIHEAIYEIAKQHKLKPAQAFQAIYRIILGKDSGPKAGMFLTTLDRNWLIKRLKLEG